MYYYMYINGYICVCVYVYVRGLNAVNPISKINKLLLFIIIINV